MDINQKCSGNCMNCIPLQRQYCASQLAFNNMRQIDALTSELRSLTEKIEAMKGDSESLFDPTGAQ